VRRRGAQSRAASRARAFLALLAAGLVCAGGAAQSDAPRAYVPRVNFQLQCMGCHLADGAGQPGRVPSVRRSLVLFSASRAGRDFVIRVPGVAQSPLSDADTAALLNWMARNLSDLPWPAGAPDYSAAEVGRLRRHPLAEVRRTRARLMRAALKTDP
jgi:cytochrome c551/c552